MNEVSQETNPLVEILADAGTEVKTADTGDAKLRVDGKDSTELDGPIFGEFYQTPEDLGAEVQEEPTLH
jgi:hypothetical protein